MAYERREGEIGALWLRENDRGDYMTGEINGVKVFCKRVKSDNPKAPTWRVEVSKPRESFDDCHAIGGPDGVR